MTFTTKQVLIISLVTATLGAGVESYYKPGTKSSETTKEVTKNNIETVIQVVKRADGSEQSTTTIIDHTVSKENSSKSLTVPNTSKGLNVSVLAGNDFSKGQFKVIYGVSLTKEVLGPITVGAFGLTNGTIGVSVGMGF